MTSRKLHRPWCKFLSPRESKWAWSMMCSLSTHYRIPPTGLHKAISSPSSSLRGHFSPLESGIALPPIPPFQSGFHRPTLDTYPHTPVHRTHPTPFRFCPSMQQPHLHLWALPLSPPAQHRGQRRRPGADCFGKELGPLLSLSPAWIGCSDLPELFLALPPPQHGWAHLMVGIAESGCAVRQPAPPAPGADKVVPGDCDFARPFKSCIGWRAAFGRTSKNRTYRGDKTNLQNSPQGRVSPWPLKSILSQTPS